MGSHHDIGGEITEKKPKNVVVYSISARDFYVDGKNIEEVFKKAKVMLKLGVKTITFQSNTRTLYPNDPGY